MFSHAGLDPASSLLFFLDSGFRRDDWILGKPRGIEPEVNKKTVPLVLVARMV